MVDYKFPKFYFPYYNCKIRKHDEFHVLRKKLFRFFLSANEWMFAVYMYFRNFVCDEREFCFTLFHNNVENFLHDIIFVDKPTKLHYRFFSARDKLWLLQLFILSTYKNIQICLSIILFTQLYGFMKVSGVEEVLKCKHLMIERVASNFEKNRRNVV